MNLRRTIFFARRWLLVEGQSEYILAHAIGDAIDFCLDAYGISVIDFQNNGNLHSFAVAARGLGIPWVALVDGDSAGERYLAKLGKYGFSTDEIASHCYRHAEPGLEAAMSVSGEALLRHAAELARIAGASTLPLPDLVNRAEKKKIDIAVKLAELIRGDPSLVDKLPPQLVAAVRAIKELSA